MRNIVCGAIVVVHSVILAHPASSQGDLAAQTDALALISQTATTLCGEVEQAGSNDEASASGRAEAGLDSLFSRLADINVQGNAALGSKEYRGVLQEQLAAALEDTRACKERVLVLLVDRVLPSTAPKLENSASRERFEAEIRSVCRNVEDWPNTIPDVALTERLSSLIAENKSAGSPYLMAEAYRCLGAAHLVSGQIPDSIRAALPFLDSSLAYNPTQELLRENIQFLSAFLQEGGGDGKKFLENLLYVVRGSKDPDVPELADQLFVVLQQK